MNDEFSNRLADVAKRFWKFRCYEEPLLAIQAGDKTVDAVLFREGPEDFERRFASSGTFLNELNGILETQLDLQERATYQLLRRELQDIRSFHHLRVHERPSLFPFGPESYALEFANTVSLTALDDAQLYVDRLQTIPDCLNGVIKNLASGHAAGMRYPRQVITNAAAAVRAQTGGALDDSPYFGPFRRTLLVGTDLERLAHLAREVISSKVVPAIRTYGAFLEGPMLADARESVSCSDAHQGGELYDTLVRHFTTTELSADELHELGRSEISRLDAEMQGVAATAGFANNLQGYRAFLSTDPQFRASSKEQLREQFEVVSKRIDPLIPALFGKVPRITYGVRSIPEAAAALLPPAYAQANPADCTGPGIHWVTSLPEKAPSFIHIPIALHEAWPGHLMHMALIQETQDLPAFRRFGSAGMGAWRYAVCLEGWALYCEGLGMEMGLYQTPHENYGRLDMEMFRALRLVVDTGIHAMGWTREQAIEYMGAYLALPRTAIESEVDRYIGTPAQALAYHVGTLKFRELRRLAEQRLGRRFDVRAFHDQVLAAGVVTLPVLERLVEDYIMRASGDQKVCEAN